MKPIDKRGKLREEPFSYTVTKAGKVLVSWNGRQVLILKESAASKFLAEVEPLDNYNAQLLMARVTGHFKHGTERK